jgi:biofilm PGA synthesis N-glycosyltransferase PgaC
LEKMQEIEMLAFMLITGGGIHSGLHDLANGANMAFRKSAFQNVKGYEGNYHFPSGDDMFLIEKMRSVFPHHIHFTKSLEASAWTYGKTNWTDLIKQRLRWASKNNGLRNKNISLTWWFVGLLHISLFLFLLLAIFHVTTWKPFLILLSSKWVADYFLLHQAATFFHRISVLRHFILSQILYSCYLFLVCTNMLMGKKSDWTR